MLTVKRAYLKHNIRNPPQYSSTLKAGREIIYAFIPLTTSQSGCEIQSTNPPLIVKTFS